MTDYNFDPHEFAGDHLPPHQPMIVTSNIKRFGAYMHIVAEGEKPGLALIIGEPGYGKTIALTNYVDNRKILPHTGLKPCVRIRVRAGGTPRSLVVDLLQALHEMPQRHNRHELADTAAAVLARNDISQILVDEADLLDVESFKMLRHVYDKRNVTIILVGSPALKGLLKRIESERDKDPSKFTSRMSGSLEFLPLETTEVLDTVLPGFVFTHWSFNPADAEDRALGQRIWQNVEHSLRALHKLLYYADRLTRLDGGSRITWATICKAQEFARPASRPLHPRAPADKRDPAVGVHEEESERRHAAQDRKRG